MQEFVAVLLGSKSDLEHANKITGLLKEFGIEFEVRVASAHKSPEHLLEIVRQYDSSKKSLVYIAVAGRSNALCGMLDGATINPVITCPLYSEKFSGMDILSSLRMPGGIACTTILEPDGAALAAIRILALHNMELQKRLQDYKRELQEKIKKDDSELKGK
ncbi:MAG: 5-(carboxyamino)imidazole ribonucleotide mutase [Candidatus Diapherotrites archaeon]|nr:5-(carboxyamino)imidazole ribonucleotide mutase [Candidatus Diapherotrites archaeon]